MLGVERQAIVNQRVHKPKITNTRILGNNFYKIPKQDYIINIAAWLETDKMSCSPTSGNETSFKHQKRANGMSFFVNFSEEWTIITHSSLTCTEELRNIT